MHIKQFRKLVLYSLMVFAVIGALVFIIKPGKSDNAVPELFNPDFDRTQYDADTKTDVDPETVIKAMNKTKRKPPNIILILTDDLGYEDLGCYGSKAISTPNIDQMASEGMRFTNFYSSAGVCSPSRAGIMTGRYPHRTGVSFVLFAGTDSIARKGMRSFARTLAKLGALDLPVGQSILNGLPKSEITVAEGLKLAGYNTGAIGKWHLGDFTTNPDYHPHEHGFDFFAGFNMSNDDWPVAYWEDKKEIVNDIQLDQAHYTGLFHQKAIEFMDKAQDKPFFLYLAHKDPHQPCIPSKTFENTSNGGRHGDTIQEVDWSVGKIMAYLESKGLADNTLVLFTSDNGPWYDGSPGNLRGRKGQSFEGGFRVPLVAWWPDRIKPDSISQAPGMNIDFLPTFLEVAGLNPPSDRIIDGKSLVATLSGASKKSPHDTLFFFHENDLEGMRQGNMKFLRYINHYTHPIPVDKPSALPGILVEKAYQYTGKDGNGNMKTISALSSWPKLYDLALDPGENYNLVEKYPEQARQMRVHMESWEKEFHRNPRGWLEN